jgi:opacity protein-like surface antigen
MERFLVSVRFLFINLYRMKPIFCALFLLFQFTTQAQKLHADIYAGVSNYQGDLQAKKFTFNDAAPAFGAGLSYDITNRFIVRGVASYMRITGKDEPGVPQYDVFNRNVNFRSRVLEAQLALEYNIFDIEERGYTPYVFAGVAAFHFSPYTFDLSGNKDYLRPLGTEGQGLPEYPEKKFYKNKQISIPFGGGVKFQLTENLQMGLEVSLRKTFTDYLDDVSGTYADSTILATARGPQAAYLAYRGSEIKEGAVYPVAGFIRGNPKSKDWYYTTMLRVSYSFGGNGGGGGGRGGGRRSRLGCPVNVY